VSSADLIDFTKENGSNLRTPHSSSRMAEITGAVVRFDIEGMMCTKSCTPTVEAALREVSNNPDAACN
jgi:hypothetical protein